MFGYHTMSEAEWNGVERNEDFISSFVYFRTAQGKFFIPSKSEGNKYDDK